MPFCVEKYFCLRLNAFLPDLFIWCMKVPRDWLLSWQVQIIISGQREVHFDSVARFRFTLLQQRGKTISDQETESFCYKNLTQQVKALSLSKAQQES